MRSQMACRVIQVIISIARHFNSLEMHEVGSLQAEENSFL